MLPLARVQTCREPHAVRGHYIAFFSHIIILGFCGWIYFSAAMYCLFNDAVSSSDYTASMGGMISEQWTGKDAEGSDRFISMSWNLSGVAEKNQERRDLPNIQQECQPLESDVVVGVKL